MIIEQIRRVLQVSVIKLQTFSFTFMKYEDNLETHKCNKKKSPIKKYSKLQSKNKQSNRSRNQNKKEC